MSKIKLVSKTESRTTIRMYVRKHIDGKATTRSVTVESNLTHEELENELKLIISKYQNPNAVFGKPVSIGYSVGEREYFQAYNCDNIDTMKDFIVGELAGN